MKTAPIQASAIKYSGSISNPHKSETATETFCCGNSTATYSPVGLLNHQAYSLIPNSFHNNISFKGSAQNIQKVAPQLAQEVGVYRAKLAAAVGTTVERLMSVLEPDELKQILKNAKPENFSTGENFENILNGTFNINLHIHSEWSDGIKSVKEILDQSAKYADYRKNVLHKNDPVIIAIADHDMMKDAKTAIEIIASDPEKYRNLRFATAIEFNAVHDSRQLEVISYCYNPFDENFNKFVESNRDKNKQYLNSFLKEHVNEWETKAGIEPEKRTTLETVINHARLKDIDGGRHLKYFGSPGLTMGFTNTLKSIFYERGWKFDGIEKFAQEHNKKYGSFAINPGTPTLSEITQARKESGSGFDGIAHPCRNLGGIDLRHLFQGLKQKGIEAVEANYQYPLNDSRFSKAFQEHADLAATESQMLKTGGCDNHSDNIFTNAFNLQSLPKAVQEIFL